MTTLEIILICALWYIVTGMLLVLIYSYVDESVPMIQRDEHAVVRETIEVICIWPVILFLGVAAIALNVYNWIVDYVEERKEKQLKNNNHGNGSKE